MRFFLFDRKWILVSELVLTYERSEMRNGMREIEKRTKRIEREEKKTKWKNGNEGFGF